MEDRIIRLEESVALQDRIIELLSDALAGQQTEIETLTRQVHLLSQRVKSAGDAGDEGPDDNQPPPHYL